MTIAIEPARDRHAPWTAGADPSVAVRALHAVLPDTVRTAEQVDRWIGEPAGWTSRKTGVERRHVAGPDDTVGSLGARAVTEVLANCGLGVGEVDAVVSTGLDSSQPSAGSPAGPHPARRPGAAGRHRGRAHARGDGGRDLMPAEIR